MSNSNQSKPKKKPISEDQIRDLYFEHDVPLKSIVPKNTKASLFIGIALLAGMLVIGGLLKVPQEVNLPFELRGGGVESIYQFNEPTKIINSYVSMNDSVKVGDPLVKIESTEVFNLLSQLKTAENSRSAYDQYTSPKLKKEIEMKEIEALNARNSFLLLESQKIDFQQKQIDLLQSLQNSIELAQKKFDRNQKLLSSGVISQQQLEEINQELVSAKAEYGNQKLEFDLRIKDIEILLLEYRQKINEISTQLELLKLSKEEEFQKSKATLQKAASVLNIKYRNPIIQEDGIILRSSIDGRVTFLSSEQQTLPSNEILLRVEGNPVPQKAYASLGSNDLASVTAGLPTALKFSNFPYFQFGTLDGTTTNVSSSSSKGQFLVEIQIHEESNQELSSRILEGMQGDATILTEEKTVLEYVFHKILKPFYQ